MTNDFNILPLKGLEPSDITLYASESGLPPTNRRLMYFYLTGLIAERERLRAMNRTDIPVRKVFIEETLDLKTNLPKQEARVIEGILRDGKLVGPRAAFKAANQSERPAPPTTAQMEAAVIAAAQKNQPANVINIDAWRSESEKQEKLKRRLTFLAQQAQFSFSPHEVKSTYAHLEQKAQQVSAFTMQKRARTALLLMNHADEFFKGDADALETAMCYVLAAPVLHKDLNQDSPGRKTRAMAYSPALAVLCKQNEAVQRDINFLNDPRCLPSTRALAVLTTYDLLANQLRDKSSIAALKADQFVHTAKFCVHVERTENNEYPQMWRQIQGEACRVRRMIMECLFAPSELKRELGVS